MINKYDFCVSVLMPVYNAQLYIKEAIESILNQTFTNFEFIIINDGSTDSSEEIINTYNDSRIVYVKNEKNLGLVQTLNRGIDLAKGKYLARMDADDISLPNRLEIQFQFMENNPDVTVVGTAFKYMNTSYQIFHPSINEQIKIKLLKNTTFAHPSVMIRLNDLFEKKLRYNEKYIYAEDYKLWADISMNNLKMANISNILLEYRQHIAQISSSKRKLQEETSQKIKEDYINFYFDSKLSVSEKKVFSNLFYENNLFSSLSLAVKISTLNDKKQYFNKKLFDTFLRELMYNSVKKISFFDLIKALRYTTKLSFFATFFNIYLKNIL